MTLSQKVSCFIQVFRSVFCLGNNVIITETLCIVCRYDAQGSQLIEPFVIGICGGSASGKTTVAQKESYLD